MAAEWFLTDGGGGPAWSLSDVNTPAVAAGAPASVSASPTGGTTLAIDWVAGSGGLPDGFDVELETPPGSGTWVAAAGAANPTLGSARLFNATGLDVITGYTPRVRAKKTGFADSAWTVGAVVYTDNTGLGGAVIGAVDGVAPAYPNGSSIGISSLTSTGYLATSPAASDAAGVTGYQWRFGTSGLWTDIPSGGRVATISGRIPASTDVLQMRARDGSGNFSDPLTTNVMLLGLAPAVTLHPTNTSAAVGGIVSFTAGFSGAPTPTYQWFKNGLAVAGATSLTYTFTANLGDTGAIYLCQATNGVGAVVSTNAAVLTVTTTAVAPSFSTQPAPQSVYENTPVTFSAVVAGTAPLTYQWRRNGVDIVGANGSSYTFTPTLADSNGVFTLRVVNSVSPVVSTPATLTVLATGSTSPFSTVRMIYVPDTSSPRDNLVLSRSRGDTFADVFVVKDAITGSPLDLSGCSFLMTVDPSANPENVDNNLFQLAGAVIDAAAGRVEFAPSPVQSDAVGSFYFDIQVTDALGRKRTLKYGSYVLIQDITKSA